MNLQLFEAAKALQESGLIPDFEPHFFKTQTRKEMGNTVRYYNTVQGLKLATQRYKKPLAAKKTTSGIALVFEGTGKIN